MKNLVEIKQFQPEQAINTINDFALTIGTNSVNTSKAYKSDVLDFVETVIGNSAFVSTNTLVANLNYKLIVKYREKLLSNGLAPSTVKRKMSALKELSKYLYRCDYKVDITIFDSLTKIKSSDNSYEVLTLEEATQLINWIKGNEKHKAIEKFYYCALAFDTGVRAEALNNLTKSSFIIQSDKVLIKGVDKGNKVFTKSISTEFYNDLVEDLDFNSKEDNEKLFNFNSARRSEMINRAKKGLGWDNRNITFHSFKKGAVTYAYDVSGDILLAQKVGSHSSVTTTQRYLKESEEVFQGAISDKKAVEVKDIKFSEFTNSELIEALSNMPESVQLALKKELLKIKK